MTGRSCAHWNPPPPARDFTRRLSYSRRPFNGQDVKQYSDRFAGFDCMISNGFPIDEEFHRFLDEMTHVLTCETPYNREHRS
jgi:hypothetical protein